jgi:hypothetical protein
MFLGCKDFRLVNKMLTISENFNLESLFYSVLHDVQVCGAGKAGKSLRWLPSELQNDYGFW